MKVTIQIRIEGSAARAVTVPLHIIDGACDQVQDVGLVFGDAKSILGKLQQALVQKQLDGYLSDRRACPHCGTPRAIKGYHPLRFRTAFGDIDFSQPPLAPLPLRANPGGYFLPTERTADGAHVPRTDVPASQVGRKSLLRGGRCAVA
jgi:hypothetical protein